MDFILAMIVSLANVKSVVGGMTVGILIYLGFMATLEIGELIWEKIPFKLFIIRIGNQLIGLGSAGAIVAVWK